ncbi:hypothetical protein BDR03DRAFT_1041897 [Suillus americanus]|nr:hypothetical protein BDR03DRAFT_1041897 [Suillus americanus]
MPVETVLEGQPPGLDLEEIGDAISGADGDGDTWTKEDILQKFSDLKVQAFGPEDLLQDQLTEEEMDEGERAPGPPPKKKLKRSAEAQARQFQRKLEKEMVRAVRKARENTAVLERAHHHKAPAHWNDSKEAEQQEWLEPRAYRMAKSSDGVPILLHLPAVIHERGEKKLHSVVMEFGKAVTLQMGDGADKEGRDRKAAYKIVKGQLAGNVKLVTAWHAVGHTKENAIISRDLIKSAKQFSLGTTLLDNLSFLNVRLNSALKELDPLQFQAMLALRAALRKKYPYVKAMETIDCLLWEGRSIQYNRQTPLHPDSTDPPKAWVALVALGHILPHEVLAFQDGQRVSIAHFTHESLWTELGVHLP